MAEPAWKAELRALAERLDQYGDAEYATAQLMPHIEAAYKRGHEAGSSKAGYRLVQENERLRRELALQGKESSCPRTAAPTAASPSPASTTEEGG